MVFTYYGHSCFCVSVGGKNILFDPFITPNELAKDIDIDAIKADYIFLSHGHFDHMTDTALIAQKTGAKVIASWELYNWCLEIGISNSQPLNPGGKWEFEFGTVHCVLAQHSSSLPDGRYAGTACGFVLVTKEGSFYYSGDTALSIDMKLISRYGALNFGVFPVGGALTMEPEDVIELASWLNIQQVVGVHYDTFGFIRIDHECTLQKFKAANVNLILLPVGACMLMTQEGTNKSQEQLTGESSS
ncbi:MAG TPA: metal-dependent hydrolase [Flavisolibacter sp.]|nr:metal-dependent hydrolase [Flavisolibacter sp.]